MQQTIAGFRFSDQAGIAGILMIMQRATCGHVAVVVALFTLRAGWLAFRNLRCAVTIQYAGGRDVTVPPGTTILDASRRWGIPYASVCGGRGRCSTCRVRIGRGFDDLPHASDSERKVLHRVGVAPDVRLACQTRPLRTVEVTPLLPLHQSSVNDAVPRLDTPMTRSVALSSCSPISGISHAFRNSAHPMMWYLS